MTTSSDFLALLKHQFRIPLQVQDLPYLSEDGYWNSLLLTCFKKTPTVPHVACLCLLWFRKGYYHD